MINFSEEANAFIISAKVDPSISGIGNHSKPKGDAPHFLGASGEAKKQWGNCSDRGSLKENKSAPSAPYPCRKITTFFTDPEVGIFSFTFNSSTIMLTP